MLENFLRKYYKIIIICLLVLLLFNTCRSCSKKQTYQFEAMEHHIIYDSLMLQINVLKDSIYDLNSINTNQSTIIRQYENTIKRLEDDKVTNKDILQRVLKSSEK